MRIVRVILDDKGKFRTDYYTGNDKYKNRRILLGLDTDTMDSFEFDKLHSIINDENFYILSGMQHRIGEYQYVFDQVFSEIGFRDNVVVTGNSNFHLRESRNNKSILNLGFTSSRYTTDNIADIIARSDWALYEMRLKILGMYSFHSLYSTEDRAKIAKNIEDKALKKLAEYNRNPNKNTANSKFYTNLLNNGISIRNFSGSKLGIYLIPCLDLGQLIKPGYNIIAISGYLRFVQMITGANIDDLVRYQLSLGENIDDPEVKKNVKKFLYGMDDNYRSKSVSKDTKAKFYNTYMKFLYTLLSSDVNNIKLFESNGSYILIGVRQGSYELSTILNRILDILYECNAHSVIDGITIFDNLGNLAFKDIYNIRADNHINILGKHISNRISNYDIKFDGHGVAEAKSNIDELGN